MSHVTDETFLAKVGHTFHSNPLVEIVHRGQTAAIKPSNNVLPTTDAFRFQLNRLTFFNLILNFCF